ncbi:hypothetical protein ACFXKC_11955 [Streptomyces sp. NPDC059340]|uniref:hypothetical protein n=1 Tax=Streptomyces sp. NPDC059340 TaxID=3346806 RepID=UPI0036A9262F
MTGQLWNELESAVSAGDSARVDRLCGLYEQQLRADYPGRFTVPAEFRHNAAATQRYVQASFAVAQRLGIAPPSSGVSEVLSRAIEECEALNQQGRYEQALAMLTDLLRSEEVLSRPPELGQAACYGRMGGLAHHLSRHQEAWRYTKTAQELCHQMHDTEGCLSYLDALYIIADETGAYPDALAVAGMATQHIQEHGPAKLLPRWLATYTEAMRRVDGPGQVGEFAKAAERYARELLGSDPAELSRTLNQLGTTLHKAGENAAARALLEEAVSLRRGGA